MTGWGAVRSTGKRFRGLPREFAPELNGALDELTPRYLLGLAFAMDAWRDRFAGDAAVRTRADALARITPALAACFDIAFNPPVVPLCEPTALDWSDLYPPARFVAAVQAARDVGIPDTWPDNIGYRDFRDAVLSRSGLCLGQFGSRSFQHPRLGAEFFGTAEWADPLLDKLSYFDYLVLRSA